MKRFLPVLLCGILFFSLLSVHGEEIPVLYSEIETIPDQLELIPLTPVLSQVKGMRRIVNNSAAFVLEMMDQRIDNFNRVLDEMEPHIPTYLYFVESSRTHPIAHAFPVDSDAYLYLKERLHVDYFDHLKYDSFDQFCQYFYSTDHHWNFRGSYQGYKDIVRMLKGEEETLLVPQGIALFPVIYHGSFCRDMKLAFSKEYFSIYNFNPFPQYTAFVNGKKRAYDHFANYLSNKINHKPLVNHYALCYGGDYGLIHFQGEQSGKGNVLVFCDSQSDAIKTLLIQHFDNIVFVDLRHYADPARGVGKPFSMRETVNQFDIHQILFLTDVSTFRSEEAQLND